jgi:hypothetical protein
MIRDDRVRVDSFPGRLVASAQLVLLAVCLFGAFGVLLAAARRNGDLAAVLDPGLERLGDPKDSLPSAPLVWVFVIGRLAAMLVYPLAFVALVSGGALLKPTWRTGDRTTFAWLAASTGSWLALGVLALTPYGTALHRWLLD